MKKILFIICVAIVSRHQAAAQTFLSGTYLIPPVPSTVNLTGNNTEYRGQYDITLKAGFEVTQGGNTDASKYFWAYIEYPPADTIYAIPEKEFDAGYTATVEGKLYFVYDEKYNTGPLNYKIYNYMHVPLNTSGIVLTRSVVGKNYFVINVSTIPGLSVASEAQKYFTLEIINDKNEKMVLRFKHP